MIKRMKRIVVYFICLCIIVANIPMSVIAEKEAGTSDEINEERKAAIIIGEGSCGENAIWKLDSTGTLTISGTGGIAESWYDYREQINYIVIEEGIVGIGKYAFRGLNKVGAIEIPETVETISYGAFYHCTNLRSIKLPESLVYWDDMFFGSDLLNLSIPKKVTYIPKNMFYGTELNSIRIPEQVTEIGDNAFGSIPVLEIYFYGDAPVFGKNIFRYSDEVTVYYPENNKTWTEEVMQEHGADNITWIPLDEEEMVSSGVCGDNLTWKLDSTGTLTISGEGEMYHYGWPSSDVSQENIYQETSPWGYTNNIYNVIIEEGVTSIGQHAFFACEGLNSIKISDSVEYIGANAFYGCYALFDVDLGTGLKEIREGMNGVFEESGIVNVDLPGSVEKVAENAFRGCERLTNVKLPDNLKVLDFGFWGCDNLREIVIPKSVTQIIGTIYRGCPLLKRIIVEEGNQYYTNDEMGVVYDIEKKTIIRVPRVLDGEYTIAEGVATVGNYAFEECLGVTSVIIPESVMTIGEYGFSGCKDITSIKFEGSIPTMGRNAILCGKSDSNVKVLYPVDNITYTEDTMLDYDGHLTWTPYGEIASFDIEILPSLKIYVNEEIDLEKLIITLHMTDGRKVVVPTSHVELSDYVFDSSGEKEIDITCLGITRTINVNVLELEEIEISKEEYPESKHPYENDMDETLVYTYENAYQLKVVFSKNTKTVNQYDKIYLYDENDKELGCYSRGDLAGKEINIKGSTIKIRLVSDSWDGEYGFSIDRIVVYKEKDSGITEENGVNITSQPQNHIGQVNDNVTFTVEASGEELKYEWFYSKDGGNTFEKTWTSGYNTNTLTPILRWNRDEQQFYCVITDKNGKSVQSDTVKMSVETSDVVITTQPVSVESGCQGTLYHFNIEAEGTNIEYRWYYSSDKGETWQESWIDGFNTNTLNIRMNPNRSGWLFRCAVTSGLKNTVVSDEVLFQLQEASVEITGNPENVVAKAGETAAFTVQATGNDLTYRWYVSTDKSEWSQTWLDGYDTATLSFPSTATRAGKYYKCVVMDGSGTVATSRAVSLTLSLPEIAVQPGNQTLAVGDRVTFKVEATGTGLRYLWYVSTDGGESWSQTWLEGYNTDTLSFTVTETRAGKQYKCVVTDMAGNVVESNPAALEVKK